ncbi:HEPN domain-containing protein [Neomoorella thermoacetica]|uniref:HEPN domain-containing protein n=1 Tax=Neomoorella thermoacetica TaxID=1525 RepID=UPI0008FB6702|nr:HEPN domain-containing protein [Moorella thermoacetica]
MEKAVCARRQENGLKRPNTTWKLPKLCTKAGRYGYTVFMCHLAIEKGLKAVIAERTGTIPPKIHDLIRLAKLAQVNLGDDKKEFIPILNTPPGGNLARH